MTDEELRIAVYDAYRQVQAGVDEAVRSSNTNQISTLTAATKQLWQVYNELCIRGMP